MATTVAAQGQGWSQPELLNTAGQALPYAGLGLDDAGNAVTTWLQAPADPVTAANQIWSKSRLCQDVTTCVWSLPVQIYSGPSLATTYVSRPQVQVSSLGDAVVVWSDADGIWTADRPAGQLDWGIPHQLATAAVPVQSAMNARGDVLVAYTTSSSPNMVAAYGLVAPTSTIWTLRRNAGETWDTVTAESIGTALKTFVSSLSLNDSGAAVIAWESSWTPTPCSPRGCPHANALHVSTLAMTGGIWQDTILASRYVLTRLPTMFEGSVAGDAVEATGIVYRDYSSTDSTYAIQTENLSDQSWSSVLPLFAGEAGKTSRVIANKCDAAGNVTVLLASNYTDSLLGQTTSVLETVNGNLSANAWGPATAIPGSENVLRTPFLSVGADGSALVAWASFDPAILAITIRTIRRSDAQGAWEPPTDIAATGPSASILATAMNGKGQSAVLYGDYDAVSGWQLFAVDLD